MVGRWSHEPKGRSPNYGAPPHGEQLGVFE